MSDDDDGTDRCYYVGYMDDDDVDSDGLEDGCCHHGVGFDEDCEECEMETEIDEAENREVEPPDFGDFVDGGRYER